MTFFRFTARHAAMSRVRLALQAGLIGQITPAMRLISVEATPAVVRVVVYYDNRLADDDRESLVEEVTTCLGAELGDPPAGPAVECHFLRCDEPLRVPVRGCVVYARKGVLTC